MHRAFGYLHARLLQLRSETGQGTVEYVALILLVAGVLASVVLAGKSMSGKEIASAIIGKLTDSIEAVGKKG